MSAWIAIVVLAIVQGATEFLPVSSSGHLSLGHALFGTDEPAVLADVVLHVGTLVAVVGVYRGDVVRTIAAFVRGLRNLPRKGWRVTMGDGYFGLAIYVLAATAVTAVLGVALKGAVETVLRGPGIVGAMLIVNGAVLWSSRWSHQPPDETRSDPVDAADDDIKGRDVVEGLTLPRALVIGLLQGLAVTPGISRSGFTITGALHMGVEGTRAARFSFLLSIPAILGALVLKLGELDASIQIDWVRLTVGAVVAAIVGWIALVFLLRLLNRARFHHFAWYCWALGAIAIGVAYGTAGAG